MTKLAKINLEQIFDGASNQALSLTVLADNNLVATASLSLVNQTKVFSANELALITEKLSAFFVKQELDESLWQNLREFLSKERNFKYLPKPLPLLLEMAVIKIIAAGVRVEVFEQITNSLGIEEKLFFLPTPLITLFNGNAYGDTNLDFEEYLLIPLTKNKNTFEQKLNNASQVYRKLAVVLQAAGYDADSGMMGAYAPDLVSTVEALDLIIASINLAGFVPATEFGLGLDIGSSNLYNREEHSYLFRLSHNYFNTANLSNLYQEWLARYPIFYLEDCLAADDLAGWQALSLELNDELILAGDKLFANDEQKLRSGLKAKLGNTVVVRLQEHDSLVDLLNFIKLAKKHNYQVVMAGADQETNDDFAADLAVALGADFVKFGALARGERVAKYNRLLTLSRQLENFF